ncbi:MAG: nucleotidyltransferase family protein, partial [Betaproteobacteria bacterium]|nr:nucleotidyltransferase family protein [Betaproteobacteria bacterium]
NRTTISHEASFVRSPVDIDLHWDILRPGRTRRPMAEDMLARRQRVGGFWALSDSDALFVMLTHPAFAKYVCSPNMGLLQVADFLLWSEAKPEAWTAAERLLDAAGLRTAAWTMLGWYGTLATPAHASRIAEWRRRLQPGRLRAAYLEYWLAHDLPGRWLDRPLRIQLGLTLWLHDRPSDALRAARGWLGSRLARSEDARSLLAGA